ncbi:TetR/AcrR family transcriptional regulator [Paraburkholderia sp. MMS20-SJTR3]|uniref:TetR/AcrR family transcriptional regulator n=1 Tax=Paraburkholderia sejongensis TaxID=2886946 RepID=A0ABS8JR06_9BURK|nr:TetR/AcrR family transcriptional regulator [Paraburkholderia sp. MMS20-SJTR3]MCC8392331.1 TetR/AcrR family transcriptional regulator [Paraburkholderia sp. MMS20-SJTR3]
MTTLPRGRPKDLTKREALLDAARELLLEHGADVTTSAIAAHAGVAKATLFAYFADKDELIDAVIRRESDRTATDAQLAQGLTMNIVDALREFGMRFTRFINERDLAGWDRLIATPAKRSPELPKRFFASGPGRGQAILASLILDAIEKGTLKECDAMQAADDLAGLWIGFSNLEVKLGARAPFTDAQLREKVDHGIDVFMRFYGPERERRTRK